MNEVIITAILSSGLAWIVGKLAFKQAVKDAIKGTLEEMKGEDEDLKKRIEKLTTEIQEHKENIDAKIYQRINNIYDAITDLKDNVRDNYVTCKYCNMQHENDSAMHKAINAKLDVLIAERNK